MSSFFLSAKEKPSTEKVSNLLAVLKFSVATEKSQSLLPETDTEHNSRSKPHSMLVSPSSSRAGPGAGRVGAVGWGVAAGAGSGAGPRLGTEALRRQAPSWRVTRTHDFRMPSGPVKLASVVARSSRWGRLREQTEV